MGTISYAEYSSLRFTNDFVFCRVLADNPELCKRIAELAIGRTIKEICSIDDQRAIKESFDGKGVRFDVVFEDEEGAIYDIEMQKADVYNLPKRTRYYQSMIDSRALKKGGDYKNMKDSFIIFVCDFDPFKLGYHRYVARTAISGIDDAAFDDGATKVFLNSHYKDEIEDRALREFLDYVRYGIITEEFSGKLETAVYKILNDEERRAEFMFLSEKYDLCREEGREIGMREARMQAVAALVKEGTFDAKKACEVLGVSYDDYQAYSSETLQ